jgi:HrpA-like RNA helicase
MSSSSVEIDPRTNKSFSANAQAMRSNARELPISGRLTEALDAVKQHVVTILVGATEGSTTQLPQALLSSLPAEKAIAVSQTRRSGAGKVSRLHFLVIICKT